MWSCTCQPPPTVDLTEALNNKHDSKTTAGALRNAMTKWGWCRVAVDLTQLSDDDSPLKTFQPLEIKQSIEALLDPAVVRQGICEAVYRGRTSESGSAEAGQAEPKQSWEVRRCCQYKNQMNQWTNALHSVAVAVTRTLQLPQNLLLNEQECHCLNDSHRCNVDLLRVFYYDAVESDETEGSSPHTDWGSWTVVWQDEVGGLQTFCHAHQRWVGVEASPLEANRACFVVHVGDVTSLAMGHATAQSKQDCSNPVVVWPSPKHRVISPTRQPRASLVYFAYPPPGVSLQDMEEALASYSTRETPNFIPYDEYFVLRNQSSGGQQSRLPQETYKSIRSQPLDSVFADKWEQVQRSG